MWEAARQDQKTNWLSFQITIQRKEDFWHNPARIVDDSVIHTITGAIGNL